MNRRRLLLTTAAGFTAVLAGCAADDDDDNDGPEGANGEADPDEGDDHPDDEGDDDDADGEDGEGETDAAEDDLERSADSELLSIIDTIEGDEPLFDSETQTFDGDGDSVTDETSLGGALTVVVSEFDDEGMDNYQVELEGEVDELLVNALEGGTFAGAVPTPSGDYLFDITAPGGWGLTVGQPLAPEGEIRTLPVEAAGEGPDVVGPVELDGGMTVSSEHDGEENFQVMIYDEDDSGLAGELVFNEIGAYEGEERADYSGICWLDVEADGEWRIEIE